MKSSVRPPAAALLFALAACATPRPPPSGPATAVAGRSSDGEGKPAWAPGPHAREALEALWAAAPFALDARTLALASGGVVPTMHRGELLLFDSRVTLDGAGRGVEVIRSAYRILDDAPNQTRVFSWSPWRQKRPVVRGRVVGPDGQESWIRATDAVEGTLDVSGLEVSDVRQLSVVLPNARLGSVVELEVVREDTRPLLEGAGAMGSWELWSIEPSRRVRLSVEAPASARLAVEVVGIPPPSITRRGVTQSVALEVGELSFSPFSLTLPELRARTPRFSWSTAESWAKVAQRYRRLLEPALADQVDFSTLEPSLARATGRAGRVEAVARWLSERVRYTAVHLGEGAIAPTLPSAVLARGFGDCKDLAVLSVLALKRAGVAADVALVNAEGPPARDGTPGLGAFNHMIVHLPATGAEASEQWLDATAPGFPWGTLPSAVREQRALIIAEGTTGLTSTPPRDQAGFVVTQRIELVAAPFGSGTGRATLEFSRAAEGTVRGALGRCDESAAHALAEGTVKRVLGEVPFNARLSGCRVGEGPVVVTVEPQPLPRLDTGDQQLEVRLPARIADDVVPTWLPGRGPTGDPRSEAQRKDDGQRTVARTGHTEEELERRAVSFENRPVIERIYRVTLPPHFALAPLPQSRSTPMGPATFTERFSVVAQGVVEARFRFEVEKVDWSVDEVKAFRGALWKRAEEPAPVVTALFAPLELLREKKPAEAMGLIRRWLSEHPTDGATRARYARILLQLGLGEQARAEVERASKDAPDDALVAMMCGDVARRDPGGTLYRPPFHRDEALTCLRRARRIDPEHGWAAVALADTLRRNTHGEPESSWTPDVEEAAGLLGALVDRREAPRAAGELLLDTYLRAGRANEARALLEAEPGLKETQGPMQVVLELLAEGSDGLLRRAARLTEPKERLAAFAMGYGAFIYLRQYEEAGAYLSRIPEDPALGRELAALKELHQGLVRAPERIDLSSPEAAARTLFAQLSWASSPTDGAERLARLASRTGGAELDGAPGLFAWVRLPPLDQGYAFDQLYARSACRADAAGGATRVSCELPERSGTAVVSFWVKEGGRLKLESLGRPRQLAARAWEAVERRDAAGGAAWLGWLVDELAARRLETGVAGLLKDYWSQADRASLGPLRFAAAVAQLVDPETVAQASGRILGVVEGELPRLSGALRRETEAVLVHVLDRQGRFDRAADRLEPLARSENEPWMWQYLATLEYQGSRRDAADRRIAAALQKDPKSPQWREVKAMAEIHRGRYPAAVEILEGLQREQAPGVDVRNNLLWARLLAGGADEALEKDALRLAEANDANQASLHTAAMVLLERGRVIDAAEYAERRLLRLEGKADESQWLLRGRLDQLLGFGELSRAAYAKAASVRDPELAVLVKRFTAGGGGGGP